MPKGRLQIRLSEQALAELERRAGGKDKRQAFIEAWLTSEPASPNGRQPVSLDARKAPLAGHDDLADEQKRLDASCLHPARARVGKKCTACGERV